LPLEATLEDRERLEEQWGLDKPVHEQYWVFLTNAVRGDFGDSIKWQGNTALDMVVKRLPATLQLGFTALLLAAILGVPLGVMSAIKRDTPMDYGGKMFAFLGQAAPAFWVGLVLMWIFAVQLGWLPASGRGGISHMVLPVIAIGWFQVASIMRLVRSSMLDQLDSEYIKLARLKGLSEQKVIWKHCLRNAAIAPLTYFGVIAGVLITGSVVIESVFRWPGVGLLAIEAVRVKDYQVLQAVVLLFAGGFVLLNLLVDILYAYLDPRIRLT
jgi:peptide/nickel transport system permease protein